MMLRLSTGSAARWLGLLVWGAILAPAAAGPPDAATFASLGANYEQEIRPLLTHFCEACHSAEEPEAELDLASFASFAQVRKQPQRWQKVREMLDSGQMPPKEATQPTAAERTKLAEWVRGYLTAEASARAGDPGRVVLRRLSNAEYTYTLRDLTGLAALDPAREFPTDGAAGEGFSNTGGALVMSPALVTKYLDAAKEVANHAVLLPDGFRFSPSVTRRDWTNEILAEIRTFYAQFSAAQGGDQVNLQGVVFETNEGGRLPLEKYFAVTLDQREALQRGSKTIDTVARERGLNAKYLGALWTSLTSDKPSLLLDGLRTRWRGAEPGDAAALAAEVGKWQQELWRFTTVGHIGKVGGPKAWMEPVSPLVDKQEIRLKFPAAIDGDEVVLSLVASESGDGNQHDQVVWHQPRLVTPGRPDLLLRDVRRVVAAMETRRQEVFASTASYLQAADELAAAPGQWDLDELADRHALDTEALRAWLEYLGIGSGGEVVLQGHFADKITSAGGHNFVQGWGSHDTPLVLANSSDQHVRVPGNMPPHSVAVHPSPKRNAVVAWKSPVAATLRVAATVTHAHPECGNGVAWSLELRRGAHCRRLATGISHGGKPVSAGPIEALGVQPGDVIALAIGPRDANHSCDLTGVELSLTSSGAEEKTWSLAADLAGNVLAGNPHDDRHGNRGVWHFLAEKIGEGNTSAVIPAGSLLAQWQAAGDLATKQKLAGDLQTLLAAGKVPAQDEANRALYRQLAALQGPLFGRLLAAASTKTADAQLSSSAATWGVDPALFGKRPAGPAGDAASLYVQAGSAVQVRLPADLAAGSELVATGRLDDAAGSQGSVQLQVVAGPGQPSPALLLPHGQTTVAAGPWTADNRQSTFGTPIVVRPGSEASQRIEAALAEYRNLFPAALCYTKIVPVDEVVTLTLLHREDDHLARLMLDDAQRAQLDRLWSELHYVSQDALTLVDAFAQLMEYATQDADPSVFEPLRQPIHDRAAAFRQRLIDAEPGHVDSLVEFAGRAYRRPLSAEESQELRALYAALRREELSYEEAFRLTLARILVGPAFLYKLEVPAAGARQQPVSNDELASRLSYFLWSSQPDYALRQVASAGRLVEDDELVAQMRRMLADGKTRRLATEFACQWLQIHDFASLDEKSERHFPEFAGLRGAMYEESIQFFVDLFQHNRSVLDILGADHAILNEQLAAHYGIPNVEGEEWRRVAGVQQFSRGGILGQAAILAKQSGASRTSPILRGNWVSEVLLGERLPRPPPGIPPLPDEEAGSELSMRQLVERHTSDAKCMICHERIDHFGFALERFDAIGRRRDKDAGDRPIDTQVTALDGAKFSGIEGLREYLLTAQREAFVRQFCRKLLGYALGRAVQLSDEPLLAEMQTRLAASDYRVQIAFEAIVTSRQFREIRGRDSANEE